MCAVSSGSVTVTAVPPEVDEGGSVTMTCNAATSNPPPRVTWWSGGRQYRGAEHTETRGLHGGVSVRSGNN